MGAQLSDVDYGWRHDLGDGSLEMDATEILMHEGSAVELGSNTMSTNTDGPAIKSMVSDSQRSQRSQGSYTQMSRRSAAAVRRAAAGAAAANAAQTRVRSASADPLAASSGSAGLQHARAADTDSGSVRETTPHGGTMATPLGAPDAARLHDTTKTMRRAQWEAATASVSSSGTSPPMNRNAPLSNTRTMTSPGRSARPQHSASPSQSPSLSPALRRATQRTHHDRPHTSGSITKTPTTTKQQANASPTTTSAVSGKRQNKPGSRLFITVPVSTSVKQTASSSAKITAVEQRAGKGRSELERSPPRGPAARSWELPWQHRSAAASEVAAAAQALAAKESSEADQRSTESGVEGQLASAVEGADMLQPKSGGSAVATGSTLDAQLATELSRKKKSKSRDSSSGRRSSASRASHRMHAVSASKRTSELSDDQSLSFNGEPCSVMRHASSDAFEVTLRGPPTVAALAQRATLQPVSKSADQNLPAPRSPESFEVDPKELEGDSGGAGGGSERISSGSEGSGSYRFNAPRHIFSSMDHSTIGTRYTAGTASATHTKSNLQMIGSGFGDLPDGSDVDISSIQPESANRDVMEDALASVLAAVPGAEDMELPDEIEYVGGDHGHVDAFGVLLASVHSHTQGSPLSPLNSQSFPSAFLSRSPLRTTGPALAVPEMATGTVFASELQAQQRAVGAEVATSAPTAAATAATGAAAVELSPADREAIASLELPAGGRVREQYAAPLLPASDTSVTASELMCTGSEVTLAPQAGLSQATSQDRYPTAPPSGEASFDTRASAYSASKGPASSDRRTASGAQVNSAEARAASTRSPSPSPHVSMDLRASSFLASGYPASADTRASTQQLTSYEVPTPTSPGNSTLDARTPSTYVSASGFSLASPRRQGGVSRQSSNDAHATRVWLLGKSDSNVSRGSNRGVGDSPFSQAAAAAVAHQGSLPQALASSGVQTSHESAVDALDSEETRDSRPEGGAQGAQHTQHSTARHAYGVSSDALPPSSMDPATCAAAPKGDTEGFSYPQDDNSAYFSGQASETSGVFTSFSFSASQCIIRPKTFCMHAAQ